MRYPERKPLAAVVVEDCAIFIDPGSKRERVFVALWTSDVEAEAHAEILRSALRWTTTSPASP